MKNTKASPWESGNTQRAQLDNFFCLGRITKVYAEQRQVEVKTFGNGRKTDQHIPRAQWLSADAHPDGDESGAMPRVNSYCMVFFVNGEPYVWGFLKPLTSNGSAVNPNSQLEELQEGDRILFTTAGNKIILRSHGEIQIESTGSCRTIYFPEGHVINTLCRNYEFRTDGGTIDWINPNEEQDNTICRTEYRQNVDRAKIVVETRGYIDDGEYITREEIGIGTDDGDITSQTYTRESKPDGTTRLFIRKAGEKIGYEQTILPSGENHLKIADKAKLDILATGELSLDIGGKHKLTIKPDGTTSIDVAGKCKIDIANSGLTQIDVAGKSTAILDPSGKVSIKGSSTIDAEAPTINLKGSKVNVGTSAAHPIPLGDLFLQAYNKFVAIFNSHTHQVPQAIAGVLPSGPPTSPSETVVGKVVLSSTVKVQP